jgi:hypothetical protein
MIFFPTDFVPMQFFEEILFPTERKPTIELLCNARLEPKDGGFS